MQAYILRPELQKFQRKAWKAYRAHKEYIEAMFGVIHNGVVIVSMFYPIEHTADIASCSFEDEDVYSDLCDIASEFKLKLIGTMHSHPGMNTCRHLSHTDERHILANASHELLTGTCHMFVSDGKKYAQTQFTCLWEPVAVKFITKGGHIRSR